MALVKIATIENLIEAQVLESVLTEREIPYRIRSFHDTAYDGLFQFQLGWGVIYAPTEYREIIMEFLQKIREQPEDGSDRIDNEDAPP